MLGENCLRISLRYRAGLTHLSHREHVLQSILNVLKLPDRLSDQAINQVEFFRENLPAHAATD